MGRPDVAVDLDEVIAVLRQRGARFAFLHGSRNRGDPRPASDTDVAAWWGRDVDTGYEATFYPTEVDLLVLDDAPLHVAGPVALHGTRLFDDDPPNRVAWQAETRKRYLDEAWRREASRRALVAAHRG